MVGHRGHRSVSKMSDQTSRKPATGIASPFLHRMILFTDWLSHANWLIQVGFIAAYTAIVVVVWGAALESFASGIPVAIINSSFTLIDWAGLSLLPRRRRSFGPVASALILFGGLRVSFTIVMAVLASEPVLASTLLLVGHFAITGYALDSMWGEPFRIGLTRLEYRSTKLDNAPPIRILHLTDFHVERLTYREDKVLDLIESLRPDMIVYTGDLLSFSYIDDSRAQVECRSLMSKLRAPLGVFAVAGTPLVDTQPVLESVLGELDNICLLNDSIISLPNYPDMKIIGLSCTHDSKLDGARLAQLVKSLPADDYKMLLYHAPDLMPEASQLNIDLVLCGHTHGGQIRLPWFGALVTSSIYWKRYEMGEYREGNTIMYVSRGIGMEGKGMPRMRFLCQPEVELISLRGVRPPEVLGFKRVVQDGAPIRRRSVGALQPVINLQDF